MQFGFHILDFPVVFASLGWLLVLTSPFLRPGQVDFNKKIEMPASRCSSADTDKNPGASLFFSCTKTAFDLEIFARPAG
jgi:hypothetical protein